MAIEKLKTLKDSTEALLVYQETIAENPGKALPSQTLWEILRKFKEESDAVYAALKDEYSNKVYAEAQEAAGYPEEFWKEIEEDRIVSRIKALREQFPSVGLNEARHIVTGKPFGEF